MASGSRLKRQQNAAVCPRDDGMDITESKVQSFIVKLWLEESGDEAGKVVWRGYVTHVPDGERRYLKRLSDVTDFIEGHLKAIGVEPDHSRFGRWLRRLSSR
jgi:hypothetical protein